jgi:hypothetical protein
MQELHACASEGAEVLQIDAVDVHGVGGLYGVQ